MHGHMDVRFAYYYIYITAVDETTRNECFGPLPQLVGQSYSSWYYVRDSTALVEVDLIIIQTSRSHSDSPHSVTLHWVIGPSQRPLPDNTQHSQQTEVHVSDGIRTTIPASERPQAQSLDHAAIAPGGSLLTFRHFAA
jgi:hypothetical protein